MQKTFKIAKTDAEKIQNVEPFKIQNQYGGLFISISKMKYLFKKSSNN